MRSIHFAWLVGLLFVHSANAQTVISDTNVTLHSPDNSIPPANFSITVWQNSAATNPTTQWFKYDGSHVSFVNGNLDEGADWYLVSPGDRFDPSTIQSGVYPVIAAAFVPPVNAAVGTSDFYLGTSTGEGYDPFMGLMKGRRTAFGWVHLGPSFPGSTTLVMLQNVMSYDSPGIVVGTTTLVPEPMTVTLLGFCGVMATAFHRRRRSLSVR